MKYKKNKRSSKILSIIITFTVLLLVVGALGWLTAGYQNWDTSTWFSSDEIIEEVEESEQSRAISLASYSSDSGTIITASVLNGSGEIDEDIQGVSWSVDWLTSTNEDISDYIALDVTDNIASISSIYKSDVQAKLIATSLQDDRVSAFITIDWLSDISFTFTYSNEDIIIYDNDIVELSKSSLTSYFTFAFNDFIGGTTATNEVIDSWNISTTTASYIGNYSKSISSTSSNYNLTTLIDGANTEYIISDASSDIVANEEDILCEAEVIQGDYIYYMTFYIDLI